MAIPDEDVARVRAATDIVALIGEHAALRRQGRRWVGLCPFHAEKTPSFSVNAEEGFYYCFGCQASGDAISFVRADRAPRLRRRGAAPRRPGRRHHPRGRRGRRATASGATSSSTPWSGPSTGTTSGCCRRPTPARPATTCAAAATTATWSGGSGSAGRRTTGTRLRRRWGCPSGCSPTAGSASSTAGAGCRTPSGPGCIFPICDPSGHPVALGGRILRRPARARLPGPVAEPRRAQVQELLGDGDLLQAADPLRAQLGQAGHHRVQARSWCARATPTSSAASRPASPERSPPAGRRWPRSTSSCLRNFATRIVLAYDADSAGQSATSRVYEWERRHEVDVAVAALPAGTDPGDLARTRPRRAAPGGRRRPAVPPVPGRPVLAGGRPVDRRGPGPGGRRRAGRGGRAPRRPGPRPVRDAGGRALPARAGAAPRAARRRPPTSAAARRSGDGRGDSGRRNGNARSGDARLPTARIDGTVRPARTAARTRATVATRAVAGPGGRTGPRATEGSRDGRRRGVAPRPRGAAPGGPPAGATSPTGWRRCSSSTTCSAGPSGRWSRPTTSTQAVDRADPEVADLLRRWPSRSRWSRRCRSPIQSTSVVTQLVREAARRALADLQARPGRRGPTSARPRPGGHGASLAGGAGRSGGVARGHGPVGSVAPRGWQEGR